MIQILLYSTLIFIWLGSVAGNKYYTETSNLSCHSFNLKCFFFLLQLLYKAGWPSVEISKTARLQ